MQLSPFYTWGVRAGKFSTMDQVVLLPRAELESCCGSHPAVLPVIEIRTCILKHCNISCLVYLIEFGVLLQ